MELNVEFNYRTVKQAVQFLGTGTHVNVPTSRHHPNGTVYSAHQLVGKSRSKRRLSTEPFFLYSYVRYTAAISKKFVPIDISHLVEMMLDFPRFAMLINPSATGRIITYGGAILFASSKLLETRAAVYKPALVVTYASEAARTAQFLRSSFGGELVTYLVGDNVETEQESDRLFLLDKSAFVHLLKSLDKKDPATARIVFVISYKALKESYCTGTLVSVKSLNEIDRERLGLCDDEDAKANCVNGAQDEELRLTSAERAACLDDSINPEGTDGLVEVFIPDDILDFGPVIWENNGVLLLKESPVHKFISALKRDSLIIVARRRSRTLGRIFLLGALRLGIRNLPKLPPFPEDYCLIRLYEDGFDPEIAIASTAYTAKAGQKRKIDSDYQPLIQAKPSTEEERMLKSEPALCKDIIDSIASQLVLQRDESTAF
ncbi:hypothetical protein F4803DRAFT_548461 [Xylaria telfairii]|nr:hypothetical protein F4803DRAFT_548461 [Xylaria telfairii]